MTVWVWLGGYVILAGIALLVFYAAVASSGDADMDERPWPRRVDAHRSRAGDEE